MKQYVYHCSVEFTNFVSTNKLLSCGMVILDKPITSKERYDSLVIDIIDKLQPNVTVKLSKDNICITSLSFLHEIEDDEKRNNL